MSEALKERTDLEAGILKLDSRKIVKRNDGKYTFHLLQEQEYTPEQVENMIKAWQSKIDEMQSWVDNFDSHVEKNIADMKEKMNHLKVKVESDLENLKKAVEMWSNPETE